MSKADDERRAHGMRVFRDRAIFVIVLTLILAWAAWGTLHPPPPVTGWSKDWRCMGASMKSGGFCLKVSGKGE